MNFFVHLPFPKRPFAVLTAPACMSLVDTNAVRVRGCADVMGLAGLNFSQVDSHTAAGNGV